MKLPIYASGMLCLALASATPSLAQESERTDVMQKTPRVVIGGQLGLSQTLNYSSGYGYRRYYAHKFHPNMGVFSRFYMGKHLALETGASFSYDNFDIDPVYNRNDVAITGISYKSVTIPVQLQYHFLSPGSRLRPYLGVGVGLSHYYFTHDYERYHWNTNSFSDFQQSQKMTHGFALITQGLTWQVNKRLQFNQSIYYRMEPQGGGSLGMSVGLGYTFLK